MVYRSSEKGCDFYSFGGRLISDKDFCYSGFVYALFFLVSLGTSHTMKKQNVKRFDSMLSVCDQTGQ